LPKYSDDDDRMRGRRPRNTAIYLEGGGNVFGNYIEGYDVGVQSTGGSFEGVSNHFKDVALPYDVTSDQAAIKDTRIHNPPKSHRPETRGAILGWRKAEGPPLPSYCPKCESVFASVVRI
jgi:hypothetical protein